MLLGDDEASASEKTATPDDDGLMDEVDEILLQFHKEWSARRSARRSAKKSKKKWRLKSPSGITYTSIKLAKASLSPAAASDWETEELRLKAEKGVSDLKECLQFSWGSDGEGIFLVFCCRYCSAGCGERGDGNGVEVLAE